MKAKYPIRTSAHVCRGALFLLTFSLTSFAQTQINLATQSKNLDLRNFPYTRPVKTGTALPATCTYGDMYLNTSATAGQNLYVCQSTNVWVQQGGLTDPGTNGVVLRNGANTTTVVTAPSGVLVGTSDAQTLTNKSIDASEVNSGVLSSTRIPSLTGDVTTAAGSSTATLANVNAAPGTYGDASHTLSLTVDAKGRVTGLSTVPVASSGPSSSYNQQLSKNGVNVSQRSTMNFSNAFAVSDNSGQVRTDLDLTQVNSNPGTFGSASAIPVLTVNAYGQITSVTTAAPQASSTSSNTVAASAGNFSSIPSACAAGSLYLATDQPLGQQFFTCSSANTWTQLVSVGGSGALAITNGSLDIVPSIVPRTNSANTFSGVNTFGNGLRLTASASQPTCDNTSRGTFWFQNNGSSKDSVQVCVYNGSAYAWAFIY